MKISDFVYNINEQTEVEINTTLKTIRVKIFSSLLKLYLSNKAQAIKQKIKDAINKFFLPGSSHLQLEDDRQTSRLSFTTDQDVTKILYSPIGKTLKVNRTQAINILEKNMERYKLGKNTKTGKVLNPIIEKVFEKINLNSILPKETPLQILTIILAVEEDMKKKIGTPTTAEKNVIGQKTGLASEDLLLGALIRRPKLIGSEKIIREKSVSHPNGITRFPDLLITAIVDGKEKEIPIEAKGRTVRSTERTKGMLQQELEKNSEKLSGLKKIIKTHEGELTAPEVRHIMYFYNAYPRDHYYYILNRKDKKDEFVQITPEKFSDDDPNRFKKFTYERDGKNYKIFGDGIYIFSIDIRGEDLYKQGKKNEPSEE